MLVELVKTKESDFHPIWLLREDQNLLATSLPDFAKLWLQSQNYQPQLGNFALIPADNGRIAGAVFGYGHGENPLITALLGKKLPEGNWYFAEDSSEPFLNILAILLGAYQFDAYISKKQHAKIRFVVPDSLDYEELRNHSEAFTLIRDLINSPANRLGPDELEQIVAKIADTHAAHITTICGNDLLKQNFPLIHAVGRASATPPRLIDMRWGNPNHPKITLVGKGVCFDSGGLDIKPAHNMLLMKKDMAGAAHMLGLAKMIMSARLPVSLRLLIPAVENSIAANSFRPGDILISRKGISVEIGDTDAEGRLILADALAYADEDEPAILIDMATLTGAARIGLGPDIVPFYCSDEDFSAALCYHSRKNFDPLWPMPLWKPYRKKLESHCADINNIASDSFAGSIIAALFLNEFIKKSGTWLHCDIYGWTNDPSTGLSIGGTVQGIRALYSLLKEKFPKRDH